MPAFSSISSILTAPSKAFSEPRDAENARLLSMLLIVSTMSTTILLVLDVFFPQVVLLDSSARAGIIGSLATNFLAYLLSRTRWSRWACFFVVVCALIGIGHAVLVNHSPLVIGQAMVWLVFNTMICVLALPLSLALVAVGATLALYLRLFLALPTDNLGALCVSLLFYVMCTLLTLIGNELRKGAMKSLEDTEKSFRQTFDHVPMGINHMSLTGEFLRMNPAYLKILGRTAEEMKTTGIHNITHPEDVAKDLLAVREMVSGKASTYSTEKRYLRKDGSLVWVALASRVVLDAEGNKSHFVTAVQDITERKATEAVIERQRESLVSASKMSALGEMSSGIAHEINNPLAIIHGKAEQLRSVAEQGPVDPDKALQMADKIITTAMRISKIITSLRKFSREGLNDPFELVQIDSIVRDTLELCRERFVNHQVKLLVEPVPEKLAIRCRPGQISQVLLNLLSNAFDAVSTLSEKRVKLEVRDLGSRVEISVTDSGPRISDEIREKIFLPFFTTKEVGKGTGLGLSISIGIIQAHLGTLVLDPGCENTRFVALLPRV